MRYHTIQRVGQGEIHWNHFFGVLDQNKGADKDNLCSRVFELPGQNWRPTLSAEGLPLAANELYAMET
jgi:hypothetical protein